MSALLDRMRGGLVVSCQPVDDGPLDDPAIVAALASAAVAGGADALRIEGIANLRATRARVSVPIIGIVKRDLEHSPVRITPYLEDVRDLADAGADIIAYDGTDRARPVASADLVAAIHATGALAMADCSMVSDGERAIAEGAEVIGTTLSGYTEATATDDPGPDLALIRAFHALDGFTMAEGRLNTPALVTQAMRAGADAATVGTALTRLEVMTGWFRDAVLAGKG